MNIEELRKKYPEFVYKKYDYNLINTDLVCDFYYEINPDLNFKHQIIVKNVSVKLFKKLNSKVLDNLIFHVGLVEMPSYWKTTCSPNIRVEARSLDEDQLAWWKKLFMYGMMQYFYTNKIDFRKEEFLRISSFQEINDKAVDHLIQNQNEVKPLVTVGGGKDSAVTLSIINKEFDNFGGLVIGRVSEAPYRVMEVAKTKTQIIIERVLDKKILEFNKLGYLNGHVPYSASLYFISLLCAYLYGYTDILFSNENSSNEGNLEYLGEVVNHQYSKTLEFENDFRDYNQRYLSNIKLFSFLRPLYELQISKIFSSSPEYFRVIRSCNVGQKQGIWCGICPKCLSTFIILFPFLGKEKTISIFGHNLFEDETLVSLLDQLISNEEIKPFECVGTRMEIKIALNMALVHHKEDKLPVLLGHFIESNEYNKELLDKTEKEYLNSWGDNNLPEKFATILKSKLN